MQSQTFICVLAGLLLFSSTIQTAVAESDQGKMRSMAEVLQILQNLDRYYSQAARPRLLLGVSDGSIAGKEGSPYTDVSKIQEAVHKIRLRELDRNYLQRTRPRFGKRGRPSMEEQMLNGEEIPTGDRQLWDRFVR